MGKTSSYKLLTAAAFIAALLSACAGGAQQGNGDAATPGGAPPAAKSSGPAEPASFGGKAEPAAANAPAGKEAAAAKPPETPAPASSPEPAGASADAAGQAASAQQPPAATPAAPPPAVAAAEQPKAEAKPAPAAEAKPPEAAPAKPAASGAEDRKALSWYYMKKKKGEVPNFPPETKTIPKEDKALWVGTGKKIYFTFDTGGPMGDTDKLLKTLKDNDAKANFFIAGYNMKQYPGFIRQLVEDGHLVANHTMTHTDMNKQTDEQVKKEIEDFAKLYKETTGQDVPPYFRFPYGSYNKHLLKLVSGMGYTSVFWSTAMVDWLPRKNGADDPYNDIMNNLHDGNIILLHQGSEENIDALDRIIKGVREAGYEPSLLSDIGKPDA